LQVDLNQAGPIPLAVRFECAPGNVLALVGPSGSGKTTVLRTIAGLYRPNEGVVRCAGATWMDSSTQTYLAPQHRTVGMVFQDYALFPHLSVSGNIQAALGHLPRAERPRRVQELLDLVNLSGLEQRRPHALSGGQQQRVAIARALARNPSVLLLDEPFSAVDQVTRRKLRRELAALRRNLQIPVVLVTHDLEEAAMLADRMCILHHGEGLQEGSPREIMICPKSVQVARLVDLQNVFEGTVLGHAQTPALTRIRWLEHELEARPQVRFTPGSRVTWAVPASGVILHRRDRPSRGERENPIAGTIESMIALGETASVTLRVDGAHDAKIVLSVPTHVAERNRIEQGGPATVSLRADAIVLMPWEKPGHPG
jgi:molybdate transport system ATP-binding protein